MGSNPRLLVLTRRSDFLLLMKSGYRVRPCGWLLVNYAVSEKGQMRCGWTLPRQVGSAVIRNRLKRWSRVYFREVLKAERSLPIDINLVFRKAEDDFFKKLDYETFAKIMDRSWQEISHRLNQKVRPVSMPGPNTKAKVNPKAGE